MRPTKFYHFRQCNSGGKYHQDSSKGICENVIIEAESPRQANKRAKDIGIYFNGVAEGKDCPCCGDRWTRFKKNSTDGTDTPQVGNISVYKIIKSENNEKAYIHYFNGTIEKVLFPLSEEEKKKEEEKREKLLSAEGWEVTTYGTEGSDMWGRIARKNKTFITLGGRNFIFTNHPPITEVRSATPKELQYIKERFRMYDQILNNA